MIERDDDDTEDYEADDEEPDEMLAECPKCGASIFDDSEKCPHCGEWIGGLEHSGSRGKRVLVTAVAVALLLWFLVRFLVR